MAKRMLYGTIEPLRMIINAIIHSQTSRRDLLCRQKVYSKPMKRCLADSICTTTPSRYLLHLPCKQAITTCSLALSEFPPPLTSVSLPQVPMFVSYECSQPMLFTSVPHVPVTQTWTLKDHPKVLYSSTSRMQKKNDSRGIRLECVRNDAQSQGSKEPIEEDILPSLLLVLLGRVEAPQPATRGIIVIFVGSVVSRQLLSRRGERSDALLLRSCLGRGGESSAVAECVRSAQCHGRTRDRHCVVCGVCR